MNPTSFRYQSAKINKSKEERDDMKRNKLLLMNEKRQRDCRLHKQVALRNNPFLEALEAKRNQEAEKNLIEKEVENFSVDDGIQLERQIKIDLDLMDVDMTADDLGAVADEVNSANAVFNACPCCYHTSLELNDGAILCTHCPLKVFSNAFTPDGEKSNQNLSLFTSSLLIYIKEHEQNGCNGQISYSFQDGIGLFSNCSDCEDIVFIA
jgi:hypothetical protein